MGKGKKSSNTDMVYPSRYSLRLEEARNEASVELFIKEAKSRRETIAKYEGEYWSQVWESDGFDIDHVKGPPHCEMQVFKRKSSILVTLYAKLGLHRYNMINGTDLQFHHIEKYNRYVTHYPSSYFITLVAKNPAIRRSLETFQTSIHEKGYNQMDLRCNVARVKNTETVGKLWNDGGTPEFCYISMPKWKKDVDFSDENRFYMVKESELKENEWIRLYLELAFLTAKRRIPIPNLPDLKIVEVMVETKEKVEKPLKGFRDATVYIKYHQDLGDGKVCKRRAVVKRNVDLKTQRMCLKGKDYLESNLESKSDDSEQSESDDSDHEASS